MDSSLARSTFFGRQNECALLKAQVIANRLTVVYARSGIGKTSLLNAGLHQALRDEGYLPLMVRINDLQRTVLDCIFDTMPELAERQSVEINDGSRRSLWHYFKTVEFWKQDLLLQPVLILDQFEELFTLRSLSDQDNLLREIGHLVRGDAPVGDGEQMRDSLVLKDRQQELTMTGPSINVILSLREDFLGLLDEASDYMPTILSNRFRLRPLSVAAASEALSAPSQLSDPAFASRMFTIDPALNHDIVSFLADEAPNFAVRIEQVDPFQLQLICQRIEDYVIRRQRQDPQYCLVTMQDMGGREALEKAMRDFYTTVLNHSCDDICSYVGPFRRALIKSRIRTLCSKQLISSEGRRLSLDEVSLLSRARIPRQTLLQLVRSRLLRSEQRVGITYYELSHDALAEQIRNKPLIIKIRFQQTLLVLALITLAVIIVFLAWYLGLAIASIFVKDWVRREFDGLNLVPSGQWSAVGPLLFSIALAFTYQRFWLWLRQLKRLNRLRRSNLRRRLPLTSGAFKSAAVTSAAVKSEPEPFGLMMDAVWHAVVLLADRRILAMLLLIVLPVALLDTQADLLNKAGLGYSYVKHPLLFVLDSVSSLLCFAILATVQQRRLVQRASTSRPCPSLRSVVVATVQAYPITGLSFDLFALFVDLADTFNRVDLRLAAWSLFVIGCFIAYRYLYLGYHYALNPISMRQALSEAPRLLAYNRWSAIVACAGAFFVLVFFGYVAGSVSNTMNSPQAEVLTFSGNLIASFLGLWVNVIVFLGYTEARLSRPL